MSNSLRFYLLLCDSHLWRSFTSNRIGRKPCCFRENYCTKNVFRLLFIVTKYVTLVHALEISNFWLLPQQQTENNLSMNNEKLLCNKRDQVYKMMGMKTGFFVWRRKRDKNWFVSHVISLNAEKIILYPQFLHCIPVISKSLVAIIPSFCTILIL